MNHKEYVRLLIDDLNTILPGNPMGFGSELNKFRLQVLVLHLHADYLLGEIIVHKLEKSRKRVDKLLFKQKLDLVYKTNDFDSDGYKVLSGLNEIRNYLSHNLIADITSQEAIINAMKIQEEVQDNLANVRLKPIHRLVFSCFGYLNFLAEYLFGRVLGEKLEKSIKIEFGKMDLGDGRPHSFTIYFGITEKA